MFNRKLALTKSDQSNSESAAARVFSLKEHLSEKACDEVLAANKRKQIAELKKFFRQLYDKEDSGTMAEVFWKPEFEFKIALNVNSKKSAESESALINLYQHKDASIDCFYCYDDKPYSHAKLLLKKSPDCMWICSMNNTEKQYRLGSLLIQIAIEQSIMNGFDGRVELVSTRQSGQFYFKLGFLPKNDAILGLLLLGKEVDGGEMYLPIQSISAWKSKIEKRPVLISPTLIIQEHKPEKSVGIC